MAHKARSGILEGISFTRSKIFQLLIKSIKINDKLAVENY